MTENLSGVLLLLAGAGSAYPCWRLVPALVRLPPATLSGPQLCPAGSCGLFFQLPFGAEVVGEGGPGAHGASLSCLPWKCPVQTSFTVFLGVPAGARCHGRPEMVLPSWAGEGWAHRQWRGLIHSTHQAAWAGSEEGGTHPAWGQAPGCILSIKINVAFFRIPRLLRPGTYTYICLYKLCI